MVVKTMIEDINQISRFLAHAQIQDLSSFESESVDCIVICASAVLHGAETLFRVLEARPNLTKTLVLCGGIGHSTSLLYSSVAQNQKYNALAKEIEGLPEARVLEKIMGRYFDVDAITAEGCKVLIEDKSTNCGANALETTKALERSGVSIPKTCIVNQDPTMALRTIASFEKVYEDLETQPLFLSCPVFVPEMEMSDSGEMCYVVPDIPANELWNTSRFFDLIMGEIPRLTDDEAGYGPKGKGYITHVEVPVEIREAWRRLKNTLGNRR